MATAALAGPAWDGSDLAFIFELAVTVRIQRNGHRQQPICIKAFAPKMEEKVKCQGKRIQKNLLMTRFDSVLLGFGPIWPIMSEV
jgi:hypothetical protein